MEGPNSAPVEAWHRELCEVTDWLYLCGDLPPNPDLAAEQLEMWRAAGITDIVDVREEWSDAELVADLAPEIRYHHLGTHDNGGTQSPRWFAEGLDALHVALQDPYAKVLVGICLPRRSRLAPRRGARGNPHRSTNCRRRLRR